MEVQREGRLRFPQSRSVLWSRKPMGASTILQLSSPTTYVSNTTLQIIARAADGLERTENASSLSGFLAGEMTVNAVESCFEFSVKRFDKGRELQGGELVPVIPVIGQYAIPIKMNDDPIERIHRLLQVKFEEDLQQAIVFSDFDIPMEVRVSLVVDGGGDVSKDVAEFYWISLVPTVKFKCVPVVPVRIVKTALFRRLSLVSSPRTDFETGYLTMNEARHCVFVLEEDVAVKSTPLVGLYVSGAPSLGDPRIVLACMRYQAASHLKHRVFIDGTHFLLCFHVNRNGVAYTDWYEVVALADDILITDCVQVRHETTIKTTMEQKGRVQLMFQTSPRITQTYKSSKASHANNMISNGTEPSSTISTYSIILSDNNSNTNKRISSFSKESTPSVRDKEREPSDDEDDNAGLTGDMEPLEQLPQPHFKAHIDVSDVSSSRISQQNSSNNSNALDLSFDESQMHNILASSPSPSRISKHNSNFSLSPQSNEGNNDSNSKRRGTSPLRNTTVVSHNSNSIASTFASVLQDHSSSITIESIHQQLVALQDQFRSLSASQQSYYQQQHQRQQQHKEEQPDEHSKDQDQPSNEDGGKAVIGSYTMLQSALSKLIQSEGQQSSTPTHTRSSSKASSSAFELANISSTAQSNQLPHDGRQCEPQPRHVPSSPKVFVQRKTKAGDETLETMGSMGSFNKHAPIPQFQRNSQVQLLEMRPAGKSDLLHVWDDDAQACDAEIETGADERTESVIEALSNSESISKQNPTSFSRSSQTCFKITDGLKIRKRNQILHGGHHGHTKAPGNGFTGVQQLGGDGFDANVLHQQNHYNEQSRSNHKAARSFGERAPNLSPLTRYDVHLKAQQITAKYLNLSNSSSQNSSHF
eukprot:m.111610 g.111610  ORF g.111610 m.111610 type:complete len:872 (-) comp9240_c0_seq1:103-2718(-)